MANSPTPHRQLIPRTKLSTINPDIHGVMRKGKYEIPMASLEFKGAVSHGSASVLLEFLMGATYPLCRGVVMSEIMTVVMTLVPDCPIFESVLPTKYCGVPVAVDIKAYGTM